MNDRIKALLRKYDVPGPRYTSYPTVPHWERTPTESEWLSSLASAYAESESKGSGSAVYIHVPFCESLCTYCGCNTRITRNHAVAHPYIDTIHREWGLYLERLGLNSVFLSDLHLGGGTPTFLTPSELERLIAPILERSRLAKKAEFSIEADPRVTTADHLKTLARLGFKRLSLGIQDFDPRVQEIVHRVQTESQVRALVEEARTLGFTSVSFDLIYGLPLQTEASVRSTIDAVRRLRPDRIAFYGYAHVPWIKPSQRRFTEADLPQGEGKRALYELGRAMLEESGYREVGMDHFALETDALWASTRQGSLHRNFMGYLPRQVHPLLGLGVSAIGDSWDAFAQNEKLLEKYEERVRAGELPIHRGHRLSKEDLFFRKRILDLMTRFETSWSDEEEGLVEGARNHLLEAGRDGLVEFSPRRCVVTEDGRALVRNICMAFDAHLARKNASSPTFSRTV